MFTLVTLVAAVLLSQSVYLGLAWQVCMTDVSLHLSSYVSCRVQCVFAISLLLMQTSHLFCLRRSSSLACRCTMGLARALGQRCGSRPQMLPKEMVLARCSAVFSV